jgi:hypothetical protein
MLAEWLLLEESRAIVPEPSSKVQRAIGLVTTCPDTVSEELEKQTKAAPQKSLTAIAW